MKLKIDATGVNFPLHRPARARAEHDAGGHRAGAQAMSGKGMEWCFAGYGHPEPGEHDRRQAGSEALAEDEGPGRYEPA